MTDLKSKRHNCDIDYDNDAWLGKKEIPFSSKLLVAIGGITSFGGLFPLAVEKTAKIMGTGSGDMDFFIVFSFGYFALPLVLYLFWIWLTDRVAVPNKENCPEKKTALSRLFNGPITYRYNWFIIFHIIAISAYLAISIYCSEKEIWISDPLVLAPILLLAPIIAISTFKKRSFPHKKVTKNWSWILFVFGVVLAGFYLFQINMKNKDYIKTLDHKGEYAEITDVDNIKKNLSILEKRISNRVDRFFIKSAVQAQVSLHDIESLPSIIDISQFHIDPYLEMLQRIMLEDEGCCKKIELSKLYLVQDECVGIYAHKDHQVKMDNDSLIDHHLFLRSGFPLSSLIKESGTLLNMMVAIDDLITKMLDEDSHRIFPECLDQRDGFEPLATDEQIYASLNLHNSKMLKDWVEQFYLPYCQRKGQSDIEEIAENTAWIWRDMHVRGIAISLATLILLALFYKELKDLKSQKINDYRNQKGQELEGSKSADENIADLNKKADYLIYPLTMAITVVAMLLIPVTAKMEISGITPTRSFWKFNVPGLPISEPIERKDTRVEDPDKDLEDLKIEILEIKELKTSIDILNRNLVRLNSNSNAHRKFENLIEKNQQDIKLYQDSINILNNELKNIKNELPKSK